MLNLLLICKVPSPFLIELAEETRRSSKKIKIDIWFSEGLTAHRGEHWIPDLQRSYVHFRQKIKEDIEPISLEELISRNRYDAILSYFSLSPKHYKIIRNGINKRYIPFIHWSESPIPQSWIIKRLKEAVYRYIADRINLVCVFAIGYRSFEQYRRILRRPIHIVPYFQKLPIMDKKAYTESVMEGEPLEFLFSGQLIERNNIKAILAAVKILEKRGIGKKIKVTLYGDGPLRREVLDFIDRNKKLNVKITDFVPKSWGDRLKPYLSSDVLLSPALYSGWGLTIPEALAFGIPVISTYGVESARYFIKEGRNGFLVDADANSIADIMEYCIDNPEIIKNMREACIESSGAGSVEEGVVILERLLPIVLTQEAGK